MKKFIYIIIALAIITILSGCGVPQIRTQNYEGAVLTINGEDNWTPDRETIDEFETKLIPYINNFKSREGNIIFVKEESLVFVKQNLKKYKRQYVGRMVNGKKILHCNFLLISGTNDNRWKHEYMEVMDGGAHYFNIDYDIETKNLLNFYINGET